MNKILEAMQTNRSNRRVVRAHAAIPNCRCGRKRRRYIGPCPGGADVATGVSKYGVVASLTVAAATRPSVRADFDPADQEATIDHARAPCGRRAPLRTTAARQCCWRPAILARTKSFSSTVRHLPAREETWKAGRHDSNGLFERFPVDAVYGLHNMPGLELGKLYFTDGPVMAAVDNWEIELIGKGSHGAMPELGIDPIVAGSSLVMALQSIVARNVAPASSAVVTVGAFQAGEAPNVVANSAVLRLSIRTTTDADRKMVLERVRTLTKGIAEAYGCKYEIREGVPGAVLVNVKRTLEAYRCKAPPARERRLSGRPIWARRTSPSCAAATGHLLLPGQRRTPMCTTRHVFNKDILPSLPLLGGADGNLK